MKGFEHDALRFAILVAMLVSASVVDLKQRRIPNWLCGSGFGVGLVLQAASDGVAGFGASAGGAVTGLLIFLPLYVVATIGAGDVKLMAAVGAFTGPAGAAVAAFASMLAAGALGLLVIALHGDLTRYLKRWRAMLSSLVLMRQFVYVAPAADEAARLRMAYAPAILLGTGFSLFCCGDIAPLAAMFG